MYSEAIIDIKDILREKFSEENFIHLAINLVNLESEDLLNSTYLNENGVVYENHIEYIKDIGKYRDIDRDTILISIVKLKHSPEKSRTMQRNFIAKHMKDMDVDASIVGLYSEDTDVWRISFVKLDYSIDIEGIHEKLTPAKRYSYLIEPGLHNHTAVEQLSKLYDDDTKKASIKDIESAFSVEVVTDEFFKMYKEKYLDLKELLEKDVNFISEAQRLDIEIHDFSEEFAKKLMGQISFLYFLQKKGWLGVKIVPKKISKVELREIYRRQDEETRNIINKVYKSEDEFMTLKSKILKDLSNDEAERLACSFKNTKYDEEWGYGTRRFIRTIFDTAIKNDFNFFNEYLEPLFYNALNQKRGSTEYYQLFNCKIPFLNGGLFEPIYKYNWEKTHIEIPNEFFSYKEFDDDNGRGLLDLFDTYNFTINEDEPLEKEVAVDPEMLGKIFENLLEVKERKSKGAFYTPREIVHYMCQESLINYLSNEVKIPYEDIEIFIKYGEIIKDVDVNIAEKEEYKMPQTIIDSLGKIDNALENVTVADPAVGSGAFPLGMLNEIVKARSIITDYGYKYSNKIDIFEHRSLYDLKKNTMKKSIFAVDIEPSAVDITKLRLWLSLVVDSDVKTVNTLPNLDYNIMVGNSLIDEYEGIKLFDEELLKDKPKRGIGHKSSQIKYKFDENNDVIGIGIEQEQEILESIQALQYELFDTKDTKRKIEIKDQIEDKEWELIKYKLSKDNKRQQLKKLERIRKENRKPYFLWNMNFSKIFKEKGGFDIVIGNPPYGAKLEKSQKESIKNKLKNTNNLNTASIFIDYAKNQWKNKEGIISYIVPKSLLYSESWYSLIESMIKNIKEIIDVEKAFENVKLEQVVFVYNSKKNINQYKAKKFLNNTFLKDTMISIDSVYKLKACICDITKEEVDIIKKLDNDKFIEMKEISTTKRGIGIQKLVNEKGQVSVLGGKNLYKFGIDGIYGKINNEDLEKNLKKLKFMKQPKIITQDIIAHIQNPKPHILITSVFDEEGKVLTLDTCQNTVLTNNNYDYRYILGLLNSEFISWYTYKFIYCSAIRTMHFDKYYIGKIKIPDVPKDKQIKLIEIVKKIEYYTRKMNNKRDNTYKKELDNLMKKLNVEVFQLYNLNEKEIQIIMENNCK